VWCTDTAVATFFVQFEWMTSSLRCTLKLEEIRYTNLDQYRHNCVLSNSDLFTATVSNSMPVAAALRTASFDRRINGKRKWNLQVSKILFPFPLLLTTYIKVNVFLFTLCGNLSWYAQKRRDQSLSSAKIGIHKDLIKSGICFRFDWLRTDPTIFEPRAKILWKSATNWRRYRFTSHWLKPKTKFCLSPKSDLYLRFVDHRVQDRRCRFFLWRHVENVVSRAWEHMVLRRMAQVGVPNVNVTCNSIEVKILYDTDMISFAMAL